jgi:hypothetical protein
MNIDAVHVAVPAFPHAKAMLLPVGGQLASLVLAPHLREYARHR